MDEAPALELLSVNKTCGTTRAARDVSMAFHRGRIHAVIGENGAGKSTALKIAAGVMAPDEGSVRIDGKPLVNATAAEAIARGVGMVQQHFALIGVFTVIENVVLGHEPTQALGRIDYAKARDKLARVARELGVELDPDALTSSLGVGDRQRLEIARVLYRDAKTVILDEPTAVLTPIEAEALYVTLRRLADEGRAIVVVTHKLDEVVAHADTVTVMRKGEVVLTRAVDRASEGEVSALADAIMGTAAPKPEGRQEKALGEELLTVRDAKLGRALRGMSLTVRGGEIVGMAGIDGNGQRELVHALAGLEVLDSGTIELGARAGVRGVSIVHEDRHGEGLVLDATVRDNLMLGELGRFGAWLDVRALQEEAEKRLRSAGIVPPDLDFIARSLSGGNQQKIVVARAVARAEKASVLVVAHPTRGVDLGAAHAIRAALRACADLGLAVLVISADLAELRALSSRIVVVARGRVVAELPSDAPDRTLGEAMLGAHRESGEVRA